MNTIGIEHNLDRARIRKLLTIGLFASVLTGIGTMFLSFGNAFMFGGLLATLPSEEQFTAFESSLHQPSEG